MELVLVPLAVLAIGLLVEAIPRGWRITIFVVALLIALLLGGGLPGDLPPNLGG